MAVKARNVTRRALRQMDRSFWYLHDHLHTLLILALPMMLASTAVAVALALFLRTWTIDDPLIGYVLYGLVLPTSIMTIWTLGPLPCSVFAWHAADGEVLSPSECFSQLTKQAGALFPLSIWLVFSFTWWSFFFGLPLLLLWPKTCLYPFIALFEKKKGTLRKRSQQLLKDQDMLHVLAGLYLLLVAALAILVFIPRVIVSSNLYKNSLTIQLQESIWIFELLCGVLLFSGMAVSWCIALTLFYRDLRFVREGEGLRRKIDRLCDKYLPEEPAT